MEVEILDHLIQEVKEKIDRLKDYIVSGAAQDYSDYTRLVGRYEMLFEQHEDLVELRSRYIES